MKYLAFDLEIAKIVSFGGDLDAQRPLGITCAAAWASDKDAPMIWCGAGKHGEISPAMNNGEVQMMLNCLQDAMYHGYTLLSFNGAGFDFKTVAEYGNLDVCKSLALLHIDMYFHLFCLLGYGPGLGRAATGMGLPGKTEGMDGAKAPELWASGQYGKVLQYVAQDVRTTLDLAIAVESAGQLTWVSKSEKPVAVKIDRWLPVIDAMVLPEPDNSWMAQPWKREKFIGWAL